LLGEAHLGRGEPIHGLRVQLCLGFAQLSRERGVDKIQLSAHAQE
jgi:hypothetical protein